MPAKYSHVKKKPAKKSVNGNGTLPTTPQKDSRQPNTMKDHRIKRPLSPAAQLERSIAQMLLIRFEQDISRLFSTHLYNIALLQIPTFMARCLMIAGPGWIAANAESEEIKDFFRGTIAMDLRQAGDRVATKSVLWSYTALRHFATSNNVSICRTRGLHSHTLLPYYPALKAHLESLQTSLPATFSKPPHLRPLKEGLRTLEQKFEKKYKKIPVGSSEWDSEWRIKLKIGYERLIDTMWRVAQEFDVRGYGTVLREKLSHNWCDCGCSTDHLSEVCERTVKEGEMESKLRTGKGREWDGRGSFHSA
jgi:RNA polymerase II-associated protein 3